MKRPWLIAVAIVVVAFLSVWAVEAGEVGVYFDPITDDRVTHVRFYGDGELGATVAVGDLTPMTTNPAKVGTVLEVPDKCLERSYTVTSWFESNGVPYESDPSMAVATIARPSVSAVLVTRTGVQQVLGENFIPGTQVKHANGIDIPTTYQSCQVLEIPDNVSAWDIIVVTPNGLIPATYSHPLTAPQGVVAE